MKKIALTVAAVLIGASALTGLEANAGPLNGIQNINPSMQPIGGNKPIYAPVNPALQPIGGKPIWNPAKNPCANGGWCDPHGGGGGGNWGHGGLAINVGLSAARMAVESDEDCYYVRRRVFVPGVGFIRKRSLVCE